MKDVDTSVPVESDRLRIARDLLQERRLHEAWLAFDEAEGMGGDPDECGAGRWQTAMLLGDFEAAWRESDAIRYRGAPDSYRFWNGEDICGKSVIVRCLHGFGDATQFLRYAPLLQSRASRLVIEVPPRMLALAPFFAGLDESRSDIVAWESELSTSSLAWDVQVEVTELPYIFRTHLDHLPIVTSYLTLSDEVLRGVALAMGEAWRPRIGVVWAAGEWNRSRSIPLELLAPAMRDSNIEWWSLQGGSAASDLCASPSAAHVRDAAKCGTGLLPLAATIANLDLVITVDTLAAHLAGALGKPCWVLLQYAGDWRWMDGRDDSPWYPTVRLFRQSSPGDWLGVVQRLRTQLAPFVRKPEHSRLISNPS